MLPPLALSLLSSAYMHQIRGLSSDSIAATHDIGFLQDLPATVEAIKNPNSKIVYDEYNHERYPPGDPSKRAFAYFVLTGGRFVYASLIRLLVLKLVLSMSASKDVLALASLEVDISSIEPGTTVTVKWRGKPVFIRRRTEEDINLANSVDVGSLRDPQENSVRVKNPEWLVIIGVCTHFWVASPCQMPVILVVGFVLATGLIMTFLVGFVKGLHLTIWRFQHILS